MLYLSENLKKYRTIKSLTQEEVAEYLGITPQSVSKWERAECYPDITFLPALANIFGTSVDMLLGMDIIRDEHTQRNIHKKALDYQRNSDYHSAEMVYAEALRIYPNNAGMILGLAGVLALDEKYEEAVGLMERGLLLCENEKQKATTRAAMCFLYLKCGKKDKAESLAAALPHTRESREVIQPLIMQGIDDCEIKRNIRIILLGE